MDTNYDLEKRFAQVVIQVGALATLLINKGIITEDEYEIAQNAFKNNDELKNRIERLEIGAKLQEILKSENISDEDIEWVKENVSKYDTEEDTQKLLNLLEFKRKYPVFDSLFKGTLW